ncbi:MULTISPECIES: carbohydrate ABC transporter permease [unclassified Oceanispirochaeta]|uniref:carbohydrate ABC transporter permease n=1 Tax=unclassified Oceanispirochaeta TaxID=2635722 RepID=UPI000E0938E9|nr:MULTISPECIES: sugar ABC transporter permease [unclassified Oceanispirochaeta]MBF9014514.1 sugar ABC transporter permease [Oceanispirochaeta sp. M2]NPD70770.1 sugar ABC transporter permease [Oceanispirochaeta sp. M1]RDG34051.1 sugar ABC transporter permease [Oceanispirochaeta sp. M1]
MKKPYGGIERKLSRWGWIFITPSLLFFSIFSFYPILNAAYTSFFRKKILSLKPPTFIGLKNYSYLLQSSDFWNSIRATFVFTVGTFIPLVVFSLLLAVLILSVRKGQKYLQLAYYAPAVLSSVVAAVIWLSIFDPRGIGNQWVNFFMNTPGIDHKWLASSFMVQFSTILVYFWKYIGYFVVIFIAGLSAIPGSLYEAARIDGASNWQSFWRITFPLLKPTVVLVSVMSMLQCLKTFSTQYLFVQAGSPQAPINVITLNIFNTGIRDHHIGRSSAMSIILFLIMLFFTWFQFKTSKADDVTY